MTSYETVLATALSEGKTAKDVVVRQVRQVVDRAARELVGRVWEKRRFRTKGGPLLAGKYGYGAAWSPDALNRLLDADGARRDDKHWSGRLTLEHVVPASTIAVIVSEMGKKGASADDVARMLRENVTQVVVVMNKYKTSGHRDQPSPRLMDADSRDRLVAHYTGGDRVTDPDEMFTIRWSRYLDVTRRDGGRHPHGGLGARRPPDRQRRHRRAHGRAELRAGSRLHLALMGASRGGNIYLIGCFAATCSGTTKKVEMLSEAPGAWPGTPAHRWGMKRPQESSTRPAALGLGDQLGGGEEADQNGAGGSLVDDVPPSSRRSRTSGLRALPRARSRRSWLPALLPISSSYRP